MKCIKVELFEGRKAISPSLLVLLLPLLPLLTVINMQRARVTFADTNIYITDAPPLGFSQPENPNHPMNGQSSHQAVPAPKLFGRLCYGSRRILRYSMSLNPETTVLFGAEILSQPVTKPASGILTILAPTLDIWEVRPSNGPFVTVLDVVVEVYKRRSNFPPYSVFNGLARNEDGHYVVELC